MALGNLETARALFPRPLDMTALLANPDALAAARAHFEPLLHPEFETLHDPRAAGMGIGRSVGEGVAEGLDGLIELFRDYCEAWDSWVVTPTGFAEVDDQRVDRKSEG
jgi:hypothetical protein